MELDAVTDLIAIAIVVLLVAASLALERIAAVLQPKDEEITR